MINQRLIQIAAVILAGIALLIASTAANAAPWLRSTIVVESQFVTLGDLFEDAGEAASVIVIDAPAPGRRSLLSLRKINDAAKESGLGWDGRTSVQRVSIERAGQKIPVDTISRAIERSLIEQGETGKKMIRLSNPRLSLYVSLDSDAEVTVETIDLHRGSGRFEAHIVAGGGQDMIRRKITGQAIAVIDIPVLSRAFQTGQVIEAGDISWLEIPARRVSGNIVTDSAMLTGKAARRALRPGVAIRTSDIQRPITVAKGSVVSLIVTTPVMTLTTEGRALENGSLGDSIRILNVASHTTVQAIVVSPNQVKVPIMARMVSAIR